MRVLGGDKERLDVGETPAVGAGERAEGTNGPVLCGQQTVRVNENAFDVPNNSVTPHEAEEKVVQEHILQRGPLLVIEIGEERTERMGASIEAMSAAKQDGCR